MNEMLLLLLGIVGIFAIASSIALIALGKMIDRYPVGDESKRERSLTSPVESTRIAVVIFWALFIIGGWAVFQENRFAMIVGITAIFSITLFMFTALVFSFAVLSTMKSRRDAMEIPLVRATVSDRTTTSPPHRENITVTSVSRKTYHQPLSQLMVSSLLKKE